MFREGARRLTQAIIGSILTDLPNRLAQWPGMSCKSSAHRYISGIAVGRRFRFSEPPIFFKENSMLISPAYAQVGGVAAGGGIEMFLPFVLIIVIFYFLLWRPQQKKMKQHKAMLGGLKRGDRVVTGGGIIGRIARVEGDDELIVEIAPEVRVRVARGTVSDVVVKGEPAKNDNAPAKGDDDAKKKKG
jgi:preprotein translocase subunit YajC